MKPACSMYRRKPVLMAVFMVLTRGRDVLINYGQKYSGLYSVVTKSLTPSPSDRDVIYGRPMTHDDERISVSNKLLEFRIRLVFK